MTSSKRLQSIKPTPQRIAIGLLVVLFLYLGLFTWNIRTGYMDTLASHTGLELTRWVLAPGRWAWSRASAFWDRYIYFVGLSQEAQTLREELAKTQQELVAVREDSAKVKRLEELLAMEPVPEWQREGARVIANRLGPNAALETFVIDKGQRQGVDLNTPVVSPQGVVGRVLRCSLSAATVLMVTDPNSRIPVVSQKTRTQGILTGRGAGAAMSLRYVSLSAPIEVGEELVTSGLEGIFPQGLPMAKVTLVTRDGASIFLNVQAQALFDPQNLEEVALLKKADPAPAPAPTMDTVEEAPADANSRHLKGVADKKADMTTKRKSKTDQDGSRSMDEAKPQKKTKGEGQ